MLTSLERVKIRLQIPSSDTSQDDLLNELIVEANVYIETYCHRQFGISQYTERHLVNHKVFPHHYPIISVDSIEREEISVIDNTSFIETHTTAYKINGNYIELLDPVYIDISNKLQWANKEQTNVTITYTAGYADDAIPADLQVAATLVVIYLYNLLGTEGMSMEKTGDYQANFTGLPEMVTNMLNKYRKVRL